jgi:tyrosyl-tRNA synthetase
MKSQHDRGKDFTGSRKPISMRFYEVTMPILSPFLQELQDRGYLYQCTDLARLDSLIASKQPISAYLGFDMTAPSLHVGSLMQIMILRLLQKHGIKPLVLVGGATSRIGDPSLRDQERTLLSDAEIDNNRRGIKEVLSRFLTFGEGPSDALMVDNADWLSDLRYIDFLRDFGRHFSVNRMLGMDSIKNRLEREQSLSFLEFNYMLLQAYDFTWLNRHHRCRIQFGGSDQWGNIVMGTDLNRRIGGEELFGVTSPLLTTAAGTKMGKTASGAVWLTGSMLSPYDYWQFWRNCDDRDVGRFLRLFTALPLAEILELETATGAALNTAKKRLATLATALCHGEQAAKQAEETASQTFEQGLSAENLPTVEIALSRLTQGIPCYELFAEVGLCASKGEARKLIRGKGARVNGEVISDEAQLITLLAGETLQLSAGKKQHMRIKAV